MSLGAGPTFANAVKRAREELLSDEELLQLPALVSSHELPEATDQLVIDEDLGKGHHPRLLVERDAPLGIHFKIDLLKRNLARVEQCLRLRAEWAAI